MLKLQPSDWLIQRAKNRCEPTKLLKLKPQFNQKSLKSIFKKMSRTSRKLKRVWIEDEDRKLLEVISEKGPKLWK